jgi:hypothetical protein
VYRNTYKRVIERNRMFFERYPDDRARVNEILHRLDTSEVRLPSGDRLTTRRFRQLGATLGANSGSENLHYMVELPLESPAFLHDVEAHTGFARNPLYAVIHESSYADGCVTNWSALRCLPAEFQEHGLFTGEHVYPWMFTDYGALAPMRDAAMSLAQYEWPRLYDGEVLRRNEVPAAAAIYLEDMYVDYELSLETARNIKGLRPWVTNEYEHNGLRADGGRILGRLIDLVRGRV